MFSAKLLEKFLEKRKSNFIFILLLPSKSNIRRCYTVVLDRVVGLSDYIKQEETEENQRDKHHHFPWCTDGGNNKKKVICQMFYILIGRSFKQDAKQLEQTIYHPSFCTQRKVVKKKCLRHSVDK